MPDAPEICRGRADLGGARLRHTAAGEGPAVALLRGWPQTRRMWRGLIPGPAARRRVVAPDLRGLGARSRPTGGCGKETLARDAWRLTRGVLGDGRPFVAGRDRGGPVAFPGRPATRGRA